MAEDDRLARAVERVIERCSASYNVAMQDERERPLVAVCEFFRRDERYAFSRKINLWTAESEEFLYIFAAPTLCADDAARALARAKEDGLSRAHIGPDHMCTYITALLLCVECDDGAKGAVRKAKFRKSFKFSLHGWAEMHAALLEIEGGEITHDKGGKGLCKLLHNL